MDSTNVISINADARVVTALETMTSQGISSIAVVDSQKMLVGNISIVDVQYVARASSAHLIRSTCAHFLSVIKFETGLRDGQDQVPVFAVYPSTTLAGTVAKLVATRAHRMWIVGNDHSSGITSLPTSTSNSNASSTPPVTPHLPVHQSLPTPQIAIQQTPPLGPTPGGLMVGRLSGVVSLTDILNLFARVEGLRPAGPTEARMNRRRSSTSSTATSTSTNTERRR
jgi:CBS domain-containing protein